MEHIEVLFAARDIIKDEKNWCQGHYAKNDKGEFVSIESVEATRYCILGAIFKANPSDHGDVDTISMGAIKAMERVLNDDYSSVHSFNDHHATSHKDVIDYLSRVISSELQMVEIRKIKRR